MACAVALIGKEDKPVICRISYHIRDIHPPNAMVSGPIPTDGCKRLFATPGLWQQNLAGLRYCHVMTQNLCSERRADNPSIIAQGCRQDTGPQFEFRKKFFVLAADAAANDDEVRRKQQL